MHGLPNKTLPAHILTSSFCMARIGGFLDDTHKIMTNLGVSQDKPVLEFTIPLSISFRFFP